MNTARTPFNISTIEPLSTKTTPRFDVVASSFGISSVITISPLEISLIVFIEVDESYEIETPL